MPKQIKFKTKHPIDFSKHLPELEKRWTKTDRELYNLVYSFGVNGCWMSNKTIGRILHRCRRSIQYSRKRLAETCTVVMARTNPRTWSMWAARHPAVPKSEKLYFKGGELPNPVYRPEGVQICGVQKMHPKGAKFAPKREEYRTSLREVIQEKSNSAELPAADSDESPGGNPPEAPRLFDDADGRSDRLKARYLLERQNKTDREVKRLFLMWQVPIEIISEYEKLVRGDHANSA